MENTDQTMQLKQVVFIFWFNLALTLFAFGTVVNAFEDNGSMFKKVCATAGFVLFLALTTFLFIRMKKLQKMAKN